MKIYPYLLFILGFVLSFLITYEWGGKRQYYKIIYEAKISQLEHQNRMLEYQIIEERFYKEMAEFTANMYKMMFEHIIKVSNEK